MRCVACNTKMYDMEVTQKKSNEDFEDLCNRCKSASFDKFNYENDHEWVHNSLEEGLKPLSLAKE